MEIKGTDLAFPRRADENFPGEQGMTLRTYIATHVMAEMALEFPEVAIHVIAADAVKFSDELIKALNKK